MNGRYNTYELKPSHYRGIKKMIKNLVSQYKDDSNTIEEMRDIRERIKFLADMGKEQFYNPNQQYQLNNERDLYILSKNSAKKNFGNTNISNTNKSSIIKNGNNHN